MASQVALEDPAETRRLTNPPADDGQVRPESSVSNVRAAEETPGAKEDPTNHERPPDPENTLQSTVGLCTFFSHHTHSHIPKVGLR